GLACPPKRQIPLEVARTTRRFRVKRSILVIGTDFAAVRAGFRLRGPARRIANRAASRDNLRISSSTLRLAESFELIPRTWVGYPHGSGRTARSRPRSSAPIDLGTAAEA